MSSLKSQIAKQGFDAAVRIAADRVLAQASKSNRSQGVPLKKNKKKKNKNPKQKNLTARLASAPTSYGTMVNKARFNIVGKASPHSLFDNNRSVKVSGSGLMSGNLQTNTTTTGLFPSNRQYLELGPAEMDTRLTGFESVFEYYTFRKLTITYVTGAPSTTVGTCFFGLSNSYDDVANYGSINNSQVMAFNTSMGTPAWGANTMSYENANGVKCYHTSTTGVSDVDDLVQFVLFGIYSYQVSTGGTVGYLIYDYEIDFYEPQPYNVTNLTKPKPESLNLSFKRNCEYVNNIIEYNNIINNNNNNNNNDDEDHQNLTTYISDEQSQIIELEK